MLVELFLQPVNVGVARAALGRVGRVRRAPSGDQDRARPSLRVVQHPAEVLRPDVDVDQHGLWPAGRLVVAVRRRERDELEGRQSTVRGTGSPSCSSFDSASWIGIVSVPGFMNRHSTPCAMSARTWASADSAGRCGMANLVAGGL